MLRRRMAGGATRRRFLKLAVYGTGGVIFTGTLAYRFGKSAASSFYRRLVELQKAPVVEIEAATLAPLTTATAVLLPEGFDPDRYADFFRYKSANVPGYGRLYARFRDAADNDARKRGARDFASAPVEIRAQVIGRASDVRSTLNSGDRIGGLKLAVFDREWLLFERYIVREILTLFSRTDAWILAGYGDPPGVPRGLELYTKAPEGLR
jgi:hypothetical protein